MSSLYIYRWHFRVDSSETTLLKGEGFASFVSSFIGFPRHRGELASSNELRWSFMLSRSLGRGENADRPHFS
jgi:hypothetical protein